jgi:hypothetical protein
VDKYKPKPIVKGRLMFCIYLLLSKAAFMKQWIVLLFTVALIAACNTKNRKEGGTKNKPRIDTEALKSNARESENSDKGKSYNWTTIEKNKFMDDCRNGAEGDDMAEGKLKDFCNCMLTQAQKFYPHYHQMEEDINEDHDAEILEKCAEAYLKKE